MVKVTNIEQLKKMAQGEVVELPGWTQDEPFYARLSRPSLQKMVAKGEIPNELLGVATDLFYQKKTDKKIDMKKLTSLQYKIVDVAMLEPTLEDVEKAGIELTDLQMIEIFNYTQQGVRALSSFREKQASDEDNKSKQNV